MLNASGGDIRAFTFKQVEVVEAAEAGWCSCCRWWRASPGVRHGVADRRRVMNPFTASQQLRLEYRAAGASAPMRQQLTIGAGEVLLASEDVVGTLFPAAGDGKGSLAVEAPDGVFVSSRTYNLGPSGTYGQAVPALAVGDLIASSDQALLPKIKSTSDFR